MESPSGSLATQVMPVVPPGASVEGCAVNPEITGRSLGLQAVIDASTMASASMSKAAFFTGDSFLSVRWRQKIPSLCSSRGSSDYASMLPTPLLRGGLRNLRGGRSDFPDCILGVTVGGTVPEFHRLATQLSRRSRSGTPGPLFNYMHYITLSGRGQSSKWRGCSPVLVDFVPRPRGRVRKASRRAGDSTLIDTPEQARLSCSVTVLIGEPCHGL